jgi:quinoprotein dehydrogenase-associated probable ABC transporter substrate-binding protein
MCSVSKVALVTVIACAGALAAVRAPRPPQPLASADRAALRVCADGNNLPFSNRRGEGFENQLAEMVAADLQRTVTYTWWPQRRGFVRNTLAAHVCDVIMGVPAAYEMAWTTRSYYRSTYVFVTRTDRRLTIRSFDDPRLRELRIGVHVIGGDYASAPPAQALANRGIVRNVVGYSIYGDYTKPNPPAVLIDAVAARDIDVAMAWGPLAGFFAARARPPLVVTPVSVRNEERSLPLAFDIAMAVRRDDAALHETLDRFIVRKREAIATLLERFHVPIVAQQTGEPTS